MRNYNIFDPEEIESLAAQKVGIALMLEMTLIRTSSDSIRMDVQKNVINPNENGLFFWPSETKKISCGQKEFFFRGSNSYNAIRFLFHQDDFKARKRDFFQEVYKDEPISDLPGALDEDMKQKIKSINKTLDEKSFPYRIRQKKEFVYLDSLKD